MKYSNILSVIMLGSLKLKPLVVSMNHARETVPKSNSALLLTKIKISNKKNSQN